MRHMGLPHGTRASRRHFTTTENCHAALHRAIGVTRAYQSDTSSKQPSSSVFFRPQPKPPPKKKKKDLLNEELEKVGPYQGAIYRTAGKHHNEERCDKSHPTPRKNAWGEGAGLQAM